MRRAASLVVAVASGLLGLATAAAPASAQEFDVDTTAAREVRFTSSTQVNEFSGTTNRIDGYVLLTAPRLSAGMPTDSSQLYFEVDLGSLHTGIGLRDRHMREDYLDVREYPYAEFKGSLERVEANTAGSFRVTAEGTMSIHGVHRRMTIPCDITPSDGGYRTHCAFQLLLSDFGISIPKLMFLKLSNRIGMDVRFSVKPPQMSGQEAHDEP